MKYWYSKNYFTFKWNVWYLCEKHQTISHLCENTVQRGILDNLHWEGFWTWLLKKSNFNENMFLTYFVKLQYFLDFNHDKQMKKE